MKQQGDPLTAVLSVSMTVPPNCPCLYRYLYRCDVIWWLHNRKKVLCKIDSFLLVSCVYSVESHDQLLFWKTMIGQCRSYDLIQVPLQFSTGMSSIRWYYLCIIKIILWYYCLFVVIWDMDVPIFVKMALQGGLLPKIRGAKGCTIHGL